MRLPDLMIIGAPRCGTSSLFNMLHQIPGFWGARVKETHFFNTHFDKGLDWYSNHFSHAPEGNLTLEATPLYLASPEAPERVKNTLPDVKMVAVLRDPVDRCISHFWWNQDKFGSDPEVLIDSNHHCVEHGHYASHLERWFDFFPHIRRGNREPVLKIGRPTQSQILIFAAEAFFDMPAAYARHVALWAGLDANVVYNKVFSGDHFDPLEWRKRKYGPPQIPTKVRSWLRLHYVSHNKRLDELLAPFEISKYWQSPTKERRQHE